MVLQLKQMEVQLEEEYEDKQKVLREKRELESKLTMLSDQVSGVRWLGPGSECNGQKSEAWEHGGRCWDLWSPLPSRVEWG